MNHIESCTHKIGQQAHKLIDENNEGWGASVRDYYNHDRIETEADALEEEAEALRLQKKKLYKMSVADFGLNEDDWIDNSDDKKTGDVVSEVLEDVKITVEMLPAERLRVLLIRYPEFEPLTNELLELYPVLQNLQHQVESESLASKSLMTDTLLKFQALSAYVGALVMYFAILSSPISKPTGETQAFNPSELRRHPIMNSLLECRVLWSKVKDYKSPSPQPTLFTVDNKPIVEENKRTNKKAVVKSPKNTETFKSSTLSSWKANSMKTTANELEELNKIASFLEKKSKKSKSSIISACDDFDDSDFGEQDSMDAKSALEKAQKKKSLGFYTSQIIQKSNKRIDAGRNAGGDDDCPHRERLRERQARLNIETERRGSRVDKNTRNNVALSEESSSSEGVATNPATEFDNDYYNFIALKAQKLKEGKINRQHAKQQSKIDSGYSLQAESETGECEKRAIGYVIEKNKGLAPKRKKDVRNPRVKKRKKFDEKKKKLESIRAIYKGGEERGGYGGEKTGIKAGLVKSVKL